MKTLPFLKSLHELGLGAKRQGCQKASVLLTLSTLQGAIKGVSGYKRVLALGSVTCHPLIMKEPAEAQTQHLHSDGS